MSKRIETETGTATLCKNGGMNLNNSGYTQRLTPEQVKEAWSGSATISWSPADTEEILAECDEDDELGHMAEFSDSYWDFGEELHIIPTKEEFDNS